MLLLISCHRTIDLKKLIINYNSKKTDFISFGSKIDGLLNDSFAINIEFSKPHKIKEFCLIDKYERNTEQRELVLLKDISIYDENLQKAISRLNWKIDDIINIENQLNIIKCISVYTYVNNKINFSLGYIRTLNGGIYKYNIFPEGADPGFIKFIQGSCDYKIIDQFSVINYESGATGSDCLPKE